MIGIFVLGMVGLWVWFSIWLGGRISKMLLVCFSSEGQALRSPMRSFLHGLIIIVIIFLPFIDQLLAYPKWQQLCSTTSDFEWGTGMDESRVVGREYYGESEIKTFTIFPNVTVTSTSMKIIDANTNELLFFKPHYNFSAKPLFKLPDASGGGASIFLHRCSTSGINGKNYEKEFQLKWVNKRNKK